MPTELELLRFCLCEKFTLGTVAVNGERFFTLEDVVREIPGAPAETWKLPQITAIPTGRYRLVIDASDRFQRETPHLLAVPAYTGIRFHRGNTVADTDGCIIQGYSASIMTGVVSQSTAAEAAFLDSLRKVLLLGECYCTVRNP